MSGTTKDIEHPGGFITINPGQKATLTANGKTATFVTTGTFHVEVTTDNGVQIFTAKATGKNLLTRPLDQEGGGLYYTTGNFTFIVDEFGNEIQGFEGNGRVVNVCDELS